MKRLILVAMVAVVAVAFTGCKKKDPSLADRANALTEQGKKDADKVTKDADKASKDVNKKLDNALNK